MTETTAQKNTHTELYELGYHLVSTLSEGDVPTETTKIRGLLEGAGAVVLTEELPKKLDLAYTISKRIGNAKERFDTSFFGFMTFEATGDVADAVRKAVDASDTILRSLIVKTVPESEKRAQPPRRTPRPEAKRTEGEATSTDAPAEEKMSKEEMDQEIEKLVV